MPPMAEIVVEAAAVARSRRRDSEMRGVMQILRLQEGGEDGGRLSQNADAPQGKLDRFVGRYHSWRTDAPTGLLLRPGGAWLGLDDLLAVGVDRKFAQHCIRWHRFAPRGANVSPCPVHVTVTRQCAWRTCRS